MSRRKRRDHHEGTFELNIVPIVDCLTILLVFMLSSGSFLAIGSLDIGIAGPNSDPAKVTKPPAIDLSIEMEPDFAMTLAVTGKMRKRIPLKPIEGIWNFKALEGELQGFKSQFPDVKGATIEANHEISYQDVVLGMEAAKKTHPEVVLGGF